MPEYGQEWNPSQEMSGLYKSIVIIIYGLIKIIRVLHNIKLIQNSGPCLNQADLEIINSRLFFSMTRGFLWTASSSGGISRFDGLSWLNFSRSNKLLSSNDYRDLAIDSTNRIWAASWGGGVAVFEYLENDSIQISEIKSDEGYLSGYNLMLILSLFPNWCLTKPEICGF